LALKTVQTFAGHSRVQVTIDSYLFGSGDRSRVMNGLAAKFAAERPSTRLDRRFLPGH
jgi:hypothetical protein